MIHRERIKWLLEFAAETNHKYGEYFFKKWKKDVKKSDAPPLPLIYIVGYSDDKFAEDFFHFVRNLEVEDATGKYGRLLFLEVFDDSGMTLSTFKGLMTQLTVDYINVLMDEEELVGS